jgi:hypothetical protein
VIVSRIPIRSLILVAAVAGLVVVGPDWPTKNAELVCGDSVGTMAVREVLADTDACGEATRRAYDAGTHCFCSVRLTWIGPAYYLGLLPLMLIGSVWLWNGPTARGMAAVAVVLAPGLLVPWPVMALYGRGVSIPKFFQVMAVAWPQLAFFGPSLFRSDSPSRVVPHEWSYISMIIFWAIASALFGAFVRRVKSFALLLSLAAAFVVATLLLVWLVVPLFGWRLLFEGP